MKDWEKDNCKQPEISNKEKMFRIWKEVIQIAREIFLEAYQRIKRQLVSLQLNEDSDEEEEEV